MFNFVIKKIYEYLSYDQKVYLKGDNDLFYVLEDIKNYIINFINVNPIDNFDYKKEASKVNDELSDKVKLQDALLVLNKVNASMDLVLLVKKRLKKYDKK